MQSMVDGVSVHEDQMACIPCYIGAAIHNNHLLAIVASLATQTSREGLG